MEDWKSKHEIVRKKQEAAVETCDVLERELQRLKIDLQERMEEVEQKEENVMEYEDRLTTMIVETKKKEIKYQTLKKKFEILVSSPIMTRSGTGGAQQQQQQQQLSSSSSLLSPSSPSLLSPVTTTTTKINELQSAASQNIITRIQTECATQRVRDFYKCDFLKFHNNFFTS